MPDEITITPKSDSGPVTAKADQDSTRVQLTNLCAFGLGLSFFFPWANFFGAQISGFTLQKLGDEYLLLWAIPIFSVISIVAGFIRQNHQLAAHITGALPFIVGVIWFTKFGSELMKILDYGAYLSLLFGAGLLVLPQKPKSSRDV